MIFKKRENRKSKLAGLSKRSSIGVSKLETAHRRIETDHQPKTITPCFLTESLLFILCLGEWLCIDFHLNLGNHVLMIVID